MSGYRCTYDRINFWVFPTAKLHFTYCHPRLTEHCVTTSRLYYSKVGVVMCVNNVWLCVKWQRWVNILYWHVRCCVWYVCVRRCVCIWVTAGWKLACVILMFWRPSQDRVISAGFVRLLRANACCIHSLIPLGLALRISRRGGSLRPLDYRRLGADDPVANSERQTCSVVLGNTVLQRCWRTISFFQWYFQKYDAL